MDRRLLTWIAALACSLVVLGLALVDRPLAEWLHGSGMQRAGVFQLGVGALDTVSATARSIWACGIFVTAIGALWVALRRRDRVGWALLAAGVVQLATVASGQLLKGDFGRLRPFQLLASGDWSREWFAGGTSFPSGHSAFYCGLFVPLAAACSPGWTRATLLAVPTFVVLGRIDHEAHFLSDVCASAMISALLSLAVATVTRRWFPPPQPRDRGRAGNSSTS